MLVLALLAAAIAALTIWRLAARLRDLDRQVKELRLLRREIEELRADLDRGPGVTPPHPPPPPAGHPPPRRGTPPRPPPPPVQPAAGLAPHREPPGPRLPR